MHFVSVCHLTTHNCRDSWIWCSAQTVIESATSAALSACGKCTSVLQAHRHVQRCIDCPWCGSAPSTRCCDVWIHSCLSLLEEKSLNNKCLSVAMMAVTVYTHIPFLNCDWMNVCFGLCFLTKTKKKSGFHLFFFCFFFLVLLKWECAPNFGASSLWKHRSGCWITHGVF